MTPAKASEWELSVGVAVQWQVQSGLDMEGHHDDAVILLKAEKKLTDHTSFMFFHASEPYDGFNSTWDDRNYFSLMVVF